MLLVRISTRARFTTYSPGPPVSFTNKTDHHDITEILLKVALSTIKQSKQTKNNQHEKSQKPKDEKRGLYPKTVDERMCCERVIKSLALYNSPANIVNNFKVDGQRLQ